MGRGNKLTRAAVATLLSVLVAACAGSGSAALNTATPGAAVANPTLAPTPTPAPTPTLAPTPSPAPTSSPAPTPVMFALSGTVTTTSGQNLAMASVGVWADRPNFCAEYLQAARSGRPLPELARSAAIQGRPYSFRLAPGRYWLLLTVKDPGFRNEFWNGSPSAWRDSCEPPVDLQADKTVDFKVPPGN